MVPARMNAALNDPRIEPAVLAAYSRPTLPPVSAVEAVTTRPADGQPAPHRPAARAAAEHHRDKGGQADPGEAEPEHADQVPSWRGPAPIRRAAEADAGEVDREDAGEDGDGGAGG